MNRPHGIRLINWSIHFFFIFNYFLTILFIHHLKFEVQKDIWLSSSIISSETELKQVRRLSKDEVVKDVATDISTGRDVQEIAVRFNNPW